MVISDPARSAAGIASNDWLRRPDRVLVAFGTLSAVPVMFGARIENTEGPTRSGVIFPSICMRQLLVIHSA
jgi:hypothetical protein